MIDKNTELILDGQTINEKGKILTLTNTEAEKNYGDPPQALLSSGTVPDIDTLIKKMGFENAIVIRVQPTGAEKLANWFNLISPILLIIGMGALYVEYKTPGFGVPGMIGIAAFAIYFLGGYVAGLAGLEWAALFLLGLLLVAVELFILPGSAFFGVSGVMLMLVAILMGTADYYPGMPTPADHAPIAVSFEKPPDSMPGHHSLHLACQQVVSSYDLLHSPGFSSGQRCCL